MSERSYHEATSCSSIYFEYYWQRVLCTLFEMSNTISTGWKRVCMFSAICLKCAIQLVLDESVSVCSLLHPAATYLEVSEELLQCEGAVSLHLPVVPHREAQAVSEIYNTAHAFYHNQYHTDGNIMPLLILSTKVLDLRVCFCSFGLSCPILEKDNFSEIVYLVLLY